MPITNSVAQGIVSSHGLDPTRYGVSDDGSSIVPLTAPTQATVAVFPATGIPQDFQGQAQAQIQQILNPSTQQSQVQVTPQDSPLVTGIKSAIDVAPSTIGAGIGAASVPAFMEGAGLTLDSTGAGALLGIPLMLGGAYIGGKSINKVQQAVEPDSYKQDLRQSQDANPKSAEIGELATLPIGGFNPSISNVGKAIGTGGKLLSGLGAAPEEIANLGNVGIGGVIGGVQPLISGDTSPTDILKGVAEGAAFNSPNKIGQKLGFHQVTPRSLMTPEGAVNALTTNTQDIQEKNSNTTLDYNTPPHVNEAMPPEFTPDNDLAARIREHNEINPMLDAGINTEPRIVGNGRLTSQESSRLEQLQGMPQEDLSDNDREEMTQLYHKYQTTTEGVQPPKQTGPVLTEAGKALQDYANSQEFKANHPDADVTQITARFFNKWAAEISSLHGLTDTFNPSLTTKGTAHIGHNTTDIGPKADAGTQGHENFHHIFEAMPQDAQQQLLTATKSEFDRYNAERVDGGQQPMEHDEYLATQMGYKAVHRLIGGTGETPLKSWWNDTKAQWNTKYGKNPLLSDLYRANTYRLLNGISFIPKGVTGGIGAVEKNQVDESKYPEPQYIGTQQAFGNLPEQKLFNLKAPIFNKDGSIKHGINSTVSDKTLRENGINVPQPKQVVSPLDKEGMANGWFAKMKAAVDKAQPEEEGLEANIQKNEQKKIYMQQRVARLRSIQRALGIDKSKELRDKNRSEHTQVVGGYKREGGAGRPLHTLQENRTPFTEPITEDTKNEKGEITQQGLLTTMRKLVNTKINRIQDSAFNKRTGKMIPKFDEPTRRDILADTLADIQKNGLDSDGLNPTISRRAYKFTQARIEAERAKLPTQSLDKPIDGGTAHDKQAAQKLEEGQVEDQEEQHIVTPEEAEKSEKIEQEKVPTESSAKPTTMREASVLLQHVEDKLEGMDKNNPTYEKLRKAATYLESKGDEEVDVNEVMKLVNGKNQKEGEGLQNNQKETEGLSPAQKYNFLWLQSSLDAARKHAGIEGKPVADALAKVAARKNEIFGEGSSKILGLESKMNSTDVNKVHTLLMKSSIAREDYRPLLSNNKQRALWDSVRESLKKQQEGRIKASEMITDWTPSKIVNGVETGNQKFTRLPKIDEHYYPSKFQQKKLDDIINRTGNYKQYLSELAKHFASEGASPEVIQEKITALKNAGDNNQPNATRFGASRITQGMGLPLSLRDPSLAKTITSYYHKISADNAWHDIVEKDPKIMHLLDEKNPNNVIHPFQSILNEIKGEPYDSDSKVIGAINRVVTANMLGLLTNAHIVGSTIFNPFQFIKPIELGSVYSTMLKNIGSYGERAFKNGYLTHDTNTVHQIIDGNSSFIERMQGLSSLIGKLNGRALSDKFSKTYAQAFGEAVVPLRITTAKGGDKFSQKLMIQLDPSWTKDKVYTTPEIQKLASIFGGFIHGAHDFRTLPELMTRDTIAKPFLSLMSWSVSQTNQWMKHVWEPAMKGEITPLIMSTLGAVVGGYLIQQMRQKISNKKTNIPSLTEIANSGRGIAGNPGLLAYNFAQMASFTGMAGIGSSLGKIGFDLAYKNIPQSATFPLDEGITNVGTTVSEAVSTFMQHPTAENFFEIMPQAMLDIAKENSQASRIALAWAADKGVASDTEEYKYQVGQGDRNLRNYKMTEGLPYDQQVESLNNPYLNMEQKRFKRTTNLGEAAQDLPEIMQLAIQRSGGNPDVFKSQMESLKQNSYQTMPSPENMPIQFAKYYQSLVKNYGQTQANLILQNYMIHNASNKVKASLVPSF